MCYNVPGGLPRKLNELIYSWPPVDIGANIVVIGQEFISVGSFPQIHYEVWNFSGLYCVYNRQ